MDAQRKWDEFYSRKNREPFLHFSSEQIKNILKDFPGSKKILDIGCGEGQLMLELEKMGFVVEGIDPSSIALEAAQKLVTGTLRLGTFEELSFAQGVKFDIIFVKFVLAFINDPSSFFEKIDRLLNDAGGLIIVTPITSRKNDNGDEEIFVQQQTVDEFIPKYFNNIREDILHAEGDKKLSLLVCKK